MRWTWIEIQIFGFSQLYQTRPLVVLHLKGLEWIDLNVVKAMIADVVLFNIQSSCMTTASDQKGVQT